MGTNRASIQERDQGSMDFDDVPMADAARRAHRLISLPSTQMTISSSAHECPCVSPLSFVAATAPLAR